MTKAKIKGLSNTEDSMWFKLSTCNETLKKLDSIFNISDDLWTEGPGDKYSYKFHTEFGEKCFHNETEEFIVYFIFSKDIAHVILRKTLKWKKYSDKIQKEFEFTK